jgi:hypothetical protein
LNKTAGGIYKTPRQSMARQSMASSSRQNDMTSDWYDKRNVRHKYHTDIA